jgi:hypothetical protein
MGCQAKKRGGSLGGVWGRRLVPVVAPEDNAKIQPSNKSKTSFCQGSGLEQ